ncbi:MAG: indole-3-glycerol phosphate synthase TrpC [Candidatus Omnitrophica bacterium]|nr:indole-3-glycerol phosphate synthase TrpC [Candidatus Omnitrophota bacterium]
MILDKIVDVKKIYLEEIKKKIPVEILEKKIFPVSPCRSLVKTFEKKPFVIIAETKKASPSAGLIKKKYSPEKTALLYQKAGADAISVLTEEKFFLGRLEDLQRVKKAVDLPVLMKDFIVDPYQLYEAKFYGADIILLIVKILSISSLKELINIAVFLKLETIIEVHDKKEIEMVLNNVSDFSKIILGINNRNLDTLETDIQTTFDLMPFLRKIKTPIISESGIKYKEDVQKLLEAGVSGILIGERLLRSKNTADELKKLLIT